MIKYNKDTEYTKGYRYKLYPTEEQKQYIDKCIEVNHYVYNWALEKEEEAYAKGEPFISEFSLCKELTNYRKENDLLKEIPNTTCRSGILNLSRAYNMYFKDTNNNKKPKFKCRGKERKQSFHTRPDRIYFYDSKIKIEGCDPIETKFKDLESIFKEIEIHDPVVSKDKLGDYYISFLVVEAKPEINLKNKQKSKEIIGIDLNNNNFFALSDETIYNSPKEKIKRLKKGISDYERKCLEDIKRHNESNSIPMSNRAQKRRTRLNKRYKKLTNVMDNTINTITKDIVMKNPKGVIMEDLDVNSMNKNHNISKNIHHYSYGKRIENMERKCNKYNIPFKKAPKDYPSSQLCSNCGNRIEIDRHKKIFKCPKCGYTEDRDINAAKNLAKIFDEI